jgi:hypothetical protein
MANRRALVVIGILLLGLLGWGVYELLTHYERDYLEVRSGASAEARRNPLLAAQRFLERLGIPTESVSGRDRLLNPPPESGLLLVTHLGPSLPAEREQALVDWIHSGGHLVTTPPREWDERAQTRGNRLLDRYGARLLPRPEPDDKELELPQPLRDQHRSSEQVLVTLSHPDSDEPLQVAFAEHRLLADTAGTAHWSVPGDGGLHVLQKRIGSGRLTVLSDTDFLTNEHIGEHDHAWLLALLARNEPKVWLLYSSNMPSLLRLLWDFAPGLVVALALLAALWVWSLALRTGPLLQREERVRRSLLEHLEAAARYAWKTDRAQGMLQRTRSAIEHEWVRRHPQLATLDGKGRSAWLAEHSGLAPRAVERALCGPVSGERDLMRSSAVQQKLMAGLAPGSGGDDTRPDKGRPAPEEV